MLGSHIHIRLCFAENESVMTGQSQILKQPPKTIAKAKGEVKAGVLGS